MTLCGLCKSSSHEYWLIRSKTEFPATIFPRRSVREKKISEG